MVESPRQFKTRGEYLKHCADFVDKHRQSHKPWIVLVRDLAPPPYQTERDDNMVDVIPRGKPIGAVVAWYEMARPIGLPTAAERRTLFIGASAGGPRDRYRFNRREAAYRAIRDARVLPLNFHPGDQQGAWTSFYNSFPRSCRDTVQQVLIAINDREILADGREPPRRDLARAPLHDLAVQWVRFRKHRAKGEEAGMLSALSRILELPVNNIGDRKLWAYLEAHAVQARRIITPLLMANGTT